MKSSPAERIVEVIRNQSRTEHGGLIVGCRYSGKSYVAREIAELEKDAGLNVLRFTERDWFPVLPQLGQKYSNHINALVDAHLQEIRQQTRVQPHCWVIDDADFLTETLTPDLAARIRLEVLNGRLRLFLVRNRFIEEGTGWHALREFSLCGGLQLRRFNLLPFEADEARQFALQQVPGELSGQEEWLAEWSGGLPGLMVRFARYSADNFTRQRKDLHPSGEIYRLAKEHVKFKGLNQYLRSTALSAALAGWLPPTFCLTDYGAIEVGFLMAAGLLAADYPSREQQLQGRFAAFAARLVGKNEPQHQDWKPALSLAELVSYAGLLSDIALEFGVKNDPLEVALVFENVHRGNIHFPEIIRPLSDVLADAFGRVGLRKLLRQAGVETSGGENISSKDLASKVLHELDRA